MTGVSESTSCADAAASSNTARKKSCVPEAGNQRQRPHADHDVTHPPPGSNPASDPKVAKRSPGVVAQRHRPRGTPTHQGHASLRRPAMTRSTPRGYQHGLREVNARPTIRRARSGAPHRAFQGRRSSHRWTTGECRVRIWARSDSAFLPAAIKPPVMAVIESLLLIRLAPQPHQRAVTFASASSCVHEGTWSRFRDHHHAGRAVDCRNALMQVNQDQKPRGWLSG